MEHAKLQIDTLNLANTFRCCKKIQLLLSKGVHYKVMPSLLKINTYDQHICWEVLIKSRSEGVNKGVYGIDAMIGR